MAIAALACVVGCTQAPATDGDQADARVDAAAATAETTVEDASAGEGAAADAVPAEEVAEASAAPAEETIAAAGDAETREAAKPAVEEYAANVPRVLLSAAHAKLCNVGVGDVLPTIELPQLGGGSANLEALAGSQGTVVLFWTPDRWMAESALRDLVRDAAGRYASDKVGLVGIVVNTPDAEAEKAATDAGAKFPQLVDADGAAFAQVGESALPRIYVLDSQRRIAWFDIEYSEATRRELQQTLAALTGAAEN